MRFSTDQLYRALDYYKYKGCPYCDGSGLHKRGDILIQKEDISIEFICAATGRKWTEVVNLKDFIK